MAGSKEGKSKKTFAVSGHDWNEQLRTGEKKQ